MEGGRGPGDRGRLHRGGGGCQWRLERVAWVEKPEGEMADQAGWIERV